MANMDSLAQLLQDEMKDVYDAERQLTKALPKLVKKASHGELRQAIEEHLRQTEQHVERLEQAFEQLGMPAKAKKCVGMQNLIKEGEEMIGDAENDATRDAVMIASAQKVEHYEIASYGTLRTWASQLGHDELARLFEETLDEEKQADERLTEIAEEVVNAEAAEGEGEEEKAEERGTTRGRAASRGGASMRAAGAGSRAGAARSQGRPSAAADRGSRGRRSR